MDDAGKLVVPCQFALVQDFRGGLARVENEDRKMASSISMASTYGERNEALANKRVQQTPAPACCMEYHGRRALLTR